MSQTPLLLGSGCQFGATNSRQSCKNYKMQHLPVVVSFGKQSHKGMSDVRQRGQLWKQLLDLQITAAVVCS